MHTAYEHIIHMQMELVPWKFSISSLPAARFGRPADTQQAILFIKAQNRGLAPLF